MCMSVNHFTLITSHVSQSPHNVQPLLVNPEWPAAALIELIDSPRHFKRPFAMHVLHRDSEGVSEYR